MTPETGKASSALPERDQPARGASAVTLLGLAWWTVRRAATTVTDINAYAWQTQTATGHQKCCQYNYKKTSAHQQLPFIRCPGGQNPPP